MYSLRWEHAVHSADTAAHQGAPSSKQRPRFACGPFLARPNSRMWDRTGSTPSPDMTPPKSSLMWLPLLPSLPPGAVHVHFLSPVRGRPAASSPPARALSLPSRASRKCNGRMPPIVSCRPSHGATSPRVPLPRSVESVCTHLVPNFSNIPSLPPTSYIPHPPAFSSHVLQQLLCPTGNYPPVTTHLLPSSVLEWTARLMKLIERCSWNAAHRWRPRAPPHPRGRCSA